jgi:hypothetical protein
MTFKERVRESHAILQDKFPLAVVTIQWSERHPWWDDWYAEIHMTGAYGMKRLLKEFYRHADEEVGE